MDRNVDELVWVKCVFGALLLLLFGVDIGCSSNVGRVMLHFN